MKIGILTYHCVPNFGAQLQTTSSVGYLRRLGHEPVVLNWYPKDLEEMYARRVPAEQIAIHNAYTKAMLPLTEICRTEEELVNAIEHNGVEAMVVGSDALFKFIPESRRKVFSWRRLCFVPRTVTSVERFEGNPFFGAFVKKLSINCPVVAFSVSSQNCPYFDMNKEELEKMRGAMQNFSLITVRDEWTKQMVEFILGVTGIRITPDPVFSFNQNSYFELPSKNGILQKYGLKKSYILISFSGLFCDSHYVNSLAVEVEKHGYQPVAFPMPEKLFGANIEKTVSLPLSPIDWYALIKYSSGYIGERMHPIVVCLHNEIPFFSFDEYGTSKSRFGGILKKYIQSSSKTFRILERAGLSAWLYSYKKNMNRPAPSQVMDMICRFDKDRCATFASDYQHHYEEEMLSVLSCLSNFDR